MMRPPSGIQHQFRPELHQNCVRACIRRRFTGKTIRHRLNRGGDRAANSALHIIAIVRLRTDPKTKAYVAKRIAEGHSKLDAIRALKRYIAREVFTLIMRRQKEINQTRIVA
jgi:transposase